MVHGTPKSEEEVRKEEERRNFQILKKLHKAVGERIAMVETAHDHPSSERAHRIAVGMLDIELHKEIRHVERIMEEKRKEHELLYNAYTQMGKKGDYSAERKRHLLEKLGPEDAAKVISTMEMDQQDEERDKQRKLLQKKLSFPQRRI